MAGDSMRYYETFYGVHIDDWEENFGGYFGATVTGHKLLVKEYISDGCSTTTSSSATDVIEFLYPQHIAKTYFIEGVISGHITLAAFKSTTSITSYEVSVYKIHEISGDRTLLFRTGQIVVNDTLTWDAVYLVGDEMVYPFWIDAWEYKELNELERIYLKIEVVSDNNAVVWHSNDSTWEDIKITIPLVM